MTVHTLTAEALKHSNHLVEALNYPRVGDQAQSGDVIFATAVLDAAAKAECDLSTSQVITSGFEAHGVRKLFQKYMPLFVLAFGLVLTPIWAATLIWFPLSLVSSALLQVVTDFWFG